MFNAGAPPVDVAHAVPDQLALAPLTVLQYLLVPAANVMLLLFLQFPSLVPDHVPEAPAATMSRKSMSDMAVSVATVSVRCVPIASERTKVRVTADAPALSVSVEIVWFALNEINLSPDAACAA